MKDITALVNDCLEKGVFPYELKLADVSPVFKQGESLDKENYRPVSILSYISKFFERIFYKQINFITKIVTFFAVLERSIIANTLF